MTNYSYNIALNMYRSLTGDYDTSFETVEDVYKAIDEEFDSGDGKFVTRQLVVDVTENGQYTYEQTEDIDAYVPVNISVNVPQKYTDAQVVELQSVARQEGYDNGYNVGFADGEDDGYQDGYADGLDDGAEDQKALLEDITITENGVYEKEDGYKKVTVEVEMPEVVQPVLTPLSVELTENGDYNYTPENDGFSSVSVTVNVASSGGGGGEGIDFSQIGYSAADNSRINDRYKADLEYSKTLISKVDGVNTLIRAFNDDKKLVFAPMGDTSKATSMYYAFYGCNKLIEIPSYDTHNVNTMQSMLYGCTSLKEVPLFDTSNVTTMYYAFFSCTSLEIVPLLNTSKVTDMSYMFSNCSKLTSIPAIDTSKVTNMYQMFNSCTSLVEIPELDCSSLTNCQYIFGFSNPTKLTTVGGFKNLGMQSTLTNTLGSYFMNNTPLTHDSIMNIINGLYDRASAGYSVITLYFGTTNLNKLTDEEKAIATNKGWTLK